MDIENATKDPASEFVSPEAVVNHPDLTWDQKKKILEKWKLDAKLMAIATDENMTGGEPNMLNQVCTLLDDLEDKQNN